jgi:hypothetical protein
LSDTGERECDSRTMTIEEKDPVKTQPMKNGRKWALYGVLLSAIAYSALTLHSTPAYAATCTAQECQDAYDFCFTNVCPHYGGMRFARCPYPDSSHYQCTCVLGTVDVSC